MTIIFVFSKHGWIIPLKDKKGETIASAIKEVMKGSRKPQNVWVDKGKKL